MNLKVVGFLTALILVLGCGVLVYAAQIIVYSPSNTVPVTVNPKPSPSPTQVQGTIVLTVNGQMSVTVEAEQNIILQAILTPASVAQVTFYMGDTELATVASNSGGTAEYLIENVLAGQYVFQAKVNTPVNIP